MRRPGAEVLDIPIRPDLSLRRLLDQMIAAGASDFIPKPIDTTKLLEALSHWLPA